VPIPELYECFALFTLFLLLVELTQPEEELPGIKAAEPGNAGSTAEQAHRVSRRWFLTIWIMAFQILPGRVLTTIAAEVVEARRCHSSKAYRVAHIVITVVQSLQTVICLTGILLFHHRLRAALRPHGGGLKLIMFKLVVLVQLVQSMVFAFLEYYKLLQPSPYVSYFDLTLGTPPALTCIEAFIFSVAFLWPFSIRRLRRSNIVPETTKLPLEAFVDVFSVSSFFHRPWRLRPHSTFHEQRIDAADLEDDPSLDEEQVVVAPKISTNS
jgi:hypothetical protein